MEFNGDFDENKYLKEWEKWDVVECLRMNINFKVVETKNKNRKPSFFFFQK